MIQFYTKLFSCVSLLPSARREEVGNSSKRCQLGKETSRQQITRPPLPTFEQPSRKRKYRGNIKESLKEIINLASSAVIGMDTLWYRWWLCLVTLRWVRSPLDNVASVPSCSCFLTQVSFPLIWFRFAIGSGVPSGKDDTKCILLFSITPVEWYKCCTGLYNNSGRGPSINYVSTPERQQKEW